jgi:PilZ domain
MQRQIEPRVLVWKRPMSLVIQRLRNNMTVHIVEHYVSELIFLSLFMTPIAFIVALIIGLGSWFWKGLVAGLWTTAVAGTATMVFLPLYIRVSCGPNTRVECERCITEEWSQRRGRNATREKRKHTRYQVDLLGTFSCGNITGCGVIKDLSAGGCRVMSQVPIDRDERIELLIKLPSREAPLKVARAVVRWCRGDEAGVEFLGMDRDARHSLSDLISQLSMVASSEARPVLG